MKKVFLPLIVLSLVLSACSLVQAEPTPSLEEIQATAQAIAMTSVAQTEMAKPTEPPTATPVPPTEEPPTEVPTEAVVVPMEVAPTEAPVIVVQPTEAATSGDGECDPFLTAGDKGQRTWVEIQNKTEGPLTLSIYLYPTKLNACGSTSVNLARNGSTTMELIEGCYFLYGWSEGIKQSQMSGEFCFNVKDGNRKWVVFNETIEQR